VTGGCPGRGIFLKGSELKGSENRKEGHIIRAKRDAAQKTLRKNPDFHCTKLVRKGEGTNRGKSRVKKLTTQKLKKNLNSRKGSSKNKKRGDQERRRALDYTSGLQGGKKKRKTGERGCPGKSKSLRRAKGPTPQRKQRLRYARLWSRSEKGGGERARERSGAVSASSEHTQRGQYTTSAPATQGKGGKRKRNDSLSSWRRLERKTKSRSRRCL